MRVFDAGDVAELITSHMYTGHPMKDDNIKLTGEKIILDDEDARCVCIIVCRFARLKSCSRWYQFYLVCSLSTGTCGFVWNDWLRTA